MDIQSCPMLDFTLISLADLGGVPGARPPMGPDSFVSTYKIFETYPPREPTPPYEVHAPLREILDPPLHLSLHFSVPDLRTGVVMLLFTTHQHGDGAASVWTGSQGC